MQDGNNNNNNSTTAAPTPAHHLWEPKHHEKAANGNGNSTEPARWESPSPSVTPREYRLRISVLKDGEFQGDAPTKVYSFPSVHHLTHATNALDNAFSSSSSGSVEIRKSGVEAPVSDVDLGHGTDGHLEDVRIEFTSSEEEDERGELREGEGWTHFLGRLRQLEDVWAQSEKGRI